MVNNILLESVLLDPRNEENIVEEAKIRVFNASKGVLNDFTENSPVSALIQGQAYAASELLYYVNKLPRAIIIDFLKVVGVQRKLGTKAVVTLTFYISAPLTSLFTIPEGFEVVDVSGNYSFLTDAPCQIPVGLTSGSVTATAENTGIEYNLAAYTLTGLTQPLTYLQAVTNTEVANGGSAEETDSEVILRGLVELKRRNPVSANDYEAFAESIMGAGSVCKAIGLLGANKITEELGAVHLFLLNSNQQPANDAQLRQVQLELSSKIQLGTSVYTSPMELLGIDGDIIARLVEGRDPLEVADELWESFQDYLNPSTYKIGDDIILNEVEYILRSSGGIQAIQSLNLNNKPINIGLPNQYTLPFARSLNITLVDIDSISYSYLRGAGEIDSFDEEL